MLLSVRASFCNTICDILMLYLRSFFIETVFRDLLQNYKKYTCYIGHFSPTTTIYIIHRSSLDNFTLRICFLYNILCL